MLKDATPLERDAIARRIPHQGSMCLLDRVLEWDEKHIRCEATSHSLADHPLRAHGRLGAACGVEYAAQAMAVHGALVAERDGNSGTTGVLAPRAGYLAGVRGVTLHVDRLDNVPCALTIEAQRVTGDGNTVLYSFSVNAGAQVMVSGRAMVVLDAAALPAGRLGTAP